MQRTGDASVVVEAGVARHDVHPRGVAHRLSHLTGGELGQFGAVRPDPGRDLAHQGGALARGHDSPDVVESATRTGHGRVDICGGRVRDSRKRLRSGRLKDIEPTRPGARLERAIDECSPQATLLQQRIDRTIHACGCLGSRGRVVRTGCRLLIPTRAVCRYVKRHAKRLTGHATFYKCFFLGGRGVPTDIPHTLRYMTRQAS